MTSLFLIFSLCVSARAAHHGPSVHQRVAMSAQRRRCDNGSGEACYAYAKLLRQFDRSRKSEANTYFRKACQMSFKPACSEASTIEKTRTHF